MFCFYNQHISIKNKFIQALGNALLSVSGGFFLLVLTIFLLQGDHSMHYFLINSLIINKSTSKTY